jgi:hypothetical protein
VQKCATKVGSYYVLGTWNALGSWGFVLCILSTLVSSVFPDFPSSYLLLNILSIHQFMSWRIHSWCLLFSSPNIADIRWGSIRYHWRFFVQVGHETTYAAIGNHHFFTKPCHRQTYEIIKDLCKASRPSPRGFA